MVTKVVVGGKESQIDDQTKNIMQFFGDAQAVQKINANEAVEFTTIDQNTWNQVLHLCKLVGNKFPQIAKVKTTDPVQVVGNDLANVLKGKSAVELNKLYQASHYLKIKNLRRSIAAVLACKVYIKPSLDDYNKKKADLGIKKQLDAELSRKMKQTYPFMN